MKKILTVFGTRPEVIKLAPVVNELKKEKKIILKNIVTAQHRQLLDQMLKVFNIKPDYDLNIMQENQSLFYITAQSLKKLKKIFEIEKPDLILVQGDTTTVLSAALCAFYMKIDVAHIESGLRSYDYENPYPEEANRRLTDALSTLCFAPTTIAKKNLLSENIPENKIFVTGNTVVDSLLYISPKVKNLVSKKIKDIVKNNKDSKIILVTAHRRENFGLPIQNIAYAIKELAQRYTDLTFIYPVHPNPNIKKPVFEILGGEGGTRTEWRARNVMRPFNVAFLRSATIYGRHWDVEENREKKNKKNIYLLPPINYFDLIYLLKKSYLVLTDSGGLQEESPTFAKPVLVLRKKTERPEGVLAGISKVIGTEKESIIKNVTELCQNKKMYQKMSKQKNPYGDGKASIRIRKVIKNFLNI